MAIMQWINPPSIETVEQEPIIPPVHNAAGQLFTKQPIIPQFPNVPSQVIVHEQAIPQQHAQDQSIQETQPIILPTD